MPQTIEIRLAPTRGYDRELTPETGGGLGIGASHPGIQTGKNNEGERKRGQSLEETHEVDLELKDEEALCENIAKALYPLDEIGECHLAVHVNGGEVTVEGQAPDERTISLVTDTIENITGVTKVHNNLKLR